MRLWLVLRALAWAGVAFVVWVCYPFMPASVLQRLGQRLAHATNDIVAAARRLA